MVDSTHVVFKAVAENLKPTPSKSHYTFNLRDLSKVVQGMLMMKLPDISDKDVLVNLWIHETFRVFRDRLINADDRDKYSAMAHEGMERYLDMGWELRDYKNVLLGSYEVVGGEQYLKLSEVNALIPRLDQYLELYNADNAPMNLVFFDDCIQHLSRVARVLGQ